MRALPRTLQTAPTRSQSLSAATRALILCCLLAAASCDGERDAPTPSPAPSSTTAQELSARELLDASEAVEKFLNAGRTNEALLVVRKLLERTPEGSASASSVHELAARVCFARARLRDETLDASQRQVLLQDAAQHARKSLTLNGKIDESVKDGAKFAFAALLISQAGESAEAAAYFDRALELLPNHPSTLLNATLTAISAGDLVRAKSLLAQRRLAAPSDPWNDGLEAEIAIAQGEASGAVTAARRAVTADGETLEFRLLLARALRKNQKPADAARLLSALEPDARAKPAIAAQYALALSESQDLRGAANAWDHALRANPADVLVRAETALAFHRAGDDTRAAAELEALVLMPGGAKERARLDTVWLR